MDQPVPRVPDIGEDPVAARDVAAAALADADEVLAEGFRSVIPRVVELQAMTIVRAWGRMTAEQVEEVTAAARGAGRRAGDEVAGAWRAEAMKPGSERRRGPLEFLRDVRRYPTAVLAEAGVPPVRRDRFSEERFPDDVYGLIVERFLDLPGGLGADMHDAHLAWGVGRAMWIKAEQALRDARRGEERG